MIVTTARELAREILAGVAFTAHGPIWCELEAGGRVRLEDLLAFHGYGEPILEVLGGPDVLEHVHRFDCADTPGAFVCSCGATAHVRGMDGPGYCIHPTGDRPAFTVTEWEGANR